jgi:L-arabinose isomerase
MRGKIDKERLSAVDGPCAIFKPDRSDVRELLNEYDYQGGSHHLTLVLEKSEDLVSKIARLTGWNYVRM